MQYQKPHSFYGANMWYLYLSNCNTSAWPCMLKENNKIRGPDLKANPKSKDYMIIDNKINGFCSKNIQFHKD